MKYDVEELKRKFEEALRAPRPFYLNPACKLEMLAKQLGTNRTYLSHYVNTQCGVNFDQLMRQLRITYAARLISDNPKWSLRLVAHRSGFTADATFRKAFVEKFGKTPKEYYQSLAD